MEKAASPCLCTNLACPLHPTKHDKGCTPCIQKNLRLEEMPTCFFNLVEGTEGRADDSFETFADCLLRNRKHIR